jgi:hypothetical protein
MMVADRARHPELVSGSQRQRCLDGWTLKQVQGDGNVSDDGEHVGLHDEQIGGSY